MSAYRWEAARADHVRGHVAMAVVPYRPAGAVISGELRQRLNPWACCFHCNDGGPRLFVAFGGKEGMERAVLHELGPRLTR